MYTRVHAQKKHVLCGRVDKRETQPKNKTSHSDTHGRKIRKRLKCVHAYMCTRSKKSQPSPTVLCAALFSYTISNTPNFTNCVRTSSDHLPSHYFPARKRKKKFWFHVQYAKKIEAKKTSRSTIHVICQR